MARKTGRLQDLMNRSLLEQSAADLTSLKADYNYLRKIIRGRQSSFEKRGVSDLWSERFAGQNVRSLNDLQDKSALLREINRITSFLHDTRSTPAGAIKVDNIMEKRRRSLGETMNRELSREDYDNIGKFLGEMQKRCKEAWKGLSDQAVKLWEEAQRLNLDPSKFIRNYEYWLEHAQSLEEARPLNYQNVKPSSYIRQLGLESVREWKKNNL